jgi:SOS-response transcriptional repressor LexA
MTADPISLTCPHCGGAFEFRARPLTRQQSAMLTYIWKSIERNGCAPSFQEIADHFDYGSLATVHEHLTNLERKGAIRRAYNEARGITVLVRPDEQGELAPVKLMVRAS